MLSGTVIRLFMVALLFGLPLMAARNSRLEDQLEAIRSSRTALYLSAAVTLLLVAGLTAGVAAWQGVSAETLGWVVADPLGGVLLAAAVTAIGLGIVWLSGVIGQQLGLTESPIVRALLPYTPTERRAFLLLAGIGAACEEYIYRGFIQAVLSDWTGNAWLAAAAASISFGLAHGYQRLNGVVRSAALGFVLAIPVIWTGSLFPSIIGHFWINAAVASGAWRWLPSPPPEEPPSGDGGPPRNRAEDAPSDSERE